MPYLFEGQRQVRIETTVYGNIQGTQHITNLTNSSFDMPGVSFISTDTGTVYHGGWSIYIDNFDAPVADTTETYDLHFTGGTFNRAYIGKSHNVNFVGSASGDQIFVDAGCKSFTRIGTSLARFGPFNGGVGGSLDSVPISGPGKWASISNIMSGSDFGCEMSAPDDNAIYTEAGKFGLPNLLNRVKTTGAGVTVTGGTLQLEAPVINTPNVSRFSAFANASLSNVTGNGTSYTVLFGAELYDNAQDYNPTTGIFTARYDGSYDLSARLRMLGMSGATSWQIQLIVAGRIYVARWDGSNINDTETLAIFEQVQMDAGDTAHVVVSVSGIGADTADVFGTAGSYQSTFCGRQVG